MKVEFMDRNNKGKEVARFFVGRDEAEMILGSMRATYKYFPITAERTQDRSRIRNIIKEIGRAFPDLVTKVKSPQLTGEQ